LTFRLSTPILDNVSIAEERPLRADARRNRELILKAAKAVIARCGMDAQMDDIARRAKVGVGTVYRHFPTKDALISALISERVCTIADYVREALEDEDAFRGLTTALWRGAELGARDRGVSLMFAAEQVAHAHKERQDLQEMSAELVRRAQAQGTLRDDFRQEDIGFLMCGVMNAINQMGHDPQAWQRHMRLIFDGMRARPDLEPLAGG
jgi:AcrR family transcriptional regulator